MTAKKILTAIILGISLALSAVKSSAQFTNIYVGLPGVEFGFVAWGDFDNDGYLDLLVTGTTDGESGPITQIWRNLGNGTFTDISAGLPGIIHGSVVLADFDNDGFLDILIAGGTNGALGTGISQIWRNVGNGTFTNINAGLPGVTRGFAACGDFNNDGRTDILLSGLNNSNTPILQLWLNLGNGKFTNINASLPGIGLSSLALADFDSDGYLDMLVTGSNGSNFLSQVWRNLGNGTFSNLNVGMPGIIYGSVALGDFDNDGRLDILIRGETNGFTANSYVSRIFRNLGNGMFANVTNAGLPDGDSRGFDGASGPVGTVAWGDFDNDGFLDVLLTGPATNNVGASLPSTSIWRNVGDGSFTNINAGLTNLWFSCASWGDFNNDGLLDILQAGQADQVGQPGSSYADVWQNLGLATNTPPTAPSNLNAVQTNRGIFMSWSAASDAQTPSSGLSYNVRVGTTPGGCDIISPMADPVTGFRRIPQLGNAQERLFTLLTNLTIGTTYYWSVQAIDTAWAGGPFAPEGSFTILPFPPTVITLAASNITTASAKVAAQGIPNDSPAALWFQYGVTTNYGNVTSATNIGSGTNLVTVTNLLSNLFGGVVYHCQAVASNGLGTTYGNDIVFSTPPFAATAIGAADLSGGAAWGDFDNDGKLDFLVVGGITAQVWRNLGGGIFSNINAGLPETQNGLPAWGDFNNDGFLDLLIPSQVWENIGDGSSFSNINVNLPGVQQGAMAWGDFDNDGHPDILITGNLGGIPTSQLWRNLGNGSFSAANAAIPGSEASSVAWGDFDNDGLVDFAISGDVSGQLVTQVWRNLGNGSFANVNAGIFVGTAATVAWGDFDNDGKLDLLVSGFNGIPVTQVWRNLGNGTFTNIQAGLPGVYSGSAVWGDFDNDGYLDILLTGITNGAATGAISQIWRNLGNGTFTNTNAGLPGVFDGSAVWGDYDNDGRLDVLLVGATNNHGNTICQAWHNATPVANTPPTAPTNLNALVTGTGAVLTWSAATDAQTPSTGLYYNIRVGTTPGGIDVVSPMADPLTGFRRVPQIGNAQERLFSFVTNLTIGTTYYWSVQAIDTAWAGGPFGTEASFTITQPSPPTISNAGYGTGTGNFGFDITGSSGFEVTVQASSNLVNWTPVWSGTLGVGPLHFADPLAGSYSNRFYRVLIP